MFSRIAQRSVSDERLLFLKESASQMYHTSAYFLGKASVGLLVEAILAVPFCVFGELVDFMLKVVGSI